MNKYAMLFLLFVLLIIPNTIYGKDKDKQKIEINNHYVDNDLKFYFDGQVDFIQEKGWSAGVYTKINFETGNFDEMGIRVKIGIGKSWVEREIEKIKEQLKKE